MDERPERVKGTVDWGKVYSERNLAQIPWNTDKPDPELTELIESGKIHPYYVLDLSAQFKSSGVSWTWTLHKQ